MLTVSEILDKLYKKNKLANLYLINGKKCNQDTLLNWMMNTIKNLLGPGHEISIEQSLQNNHPDILVIDNNDEKFKKEHFDNFYTFMKYNPVNLKQRFVIINNIHTASDIIINKLLKTLESPNIRATIFLLNPLSNRLLSTLESRSLILRPTQKELGLLEITNKDNDCEEVFNLINSYLRKEILLHEFVGSIKSINNGDQLLLSCVADLETKNYSNYIFKEKIIQEIEHFKLSKTFNNSAQERIVSLCHILDTTRLD